MEEDAAKHEQHKRQNEETDNNDEEEEREKDKAERLQREGESKECEAEIKKITDEIEVLNKHRESSSSFSHPTHFVMILQVIHALLLDGALKEAFDIGQNR